MAAGDATVQVVDPTTSAVDTSLTALRNGANDKWLMCSIHNGSKVLIANIEEA